MSSSSALTNSPCAACKLLRRKCTQECVFAPYFPPDNPQKFANVHRVFGASNVSKLLKELNPNQREDAVNSLAYEAEFRLRDPVYGCVGLISILQHRLRQVQTDLENAKKEIAAYIGPGPSAMLPILNNFSSNSVLGYNNSNNNVTPILGIPTQAGQMMIRENHMIDANEMLRISYNEQQQQSGNENIVRFSNGSGFDLVGFNQMGTSVSSSDGSFQIQTPLTAQLLVQPDQEQEQQQQPTPLQQRSGNDGRIVGLSC